MPMFGSAFDPSQFLSPLNMGAMPAAQPAPVASGGFQPKGLSLGDKIGLVGDIWSGNPVTQKRLDGDYQADLQQYQLNHPAAQNVAGVGLVQSDPMTGTYKTVVPDQPKMDSFGTALLAAGFRPGTPEWQNQYRLKVNSEVDPIHAYPTTDQQGNQGLLFKRPSEMGGAGIPPTQVKDAAGYNALPPGAPYIDPNGQHRVKGGAAPGTGPGGFPLRPTH